MTLLPSSRPRLRRSIALVPVASGEIYVHGPAGPSRLVGPGAEALRAALPLLDGRRTLAEIVQEGDAAPGTFERMLRALEAAGIVEDALVARSHAGPTEAFLSHLGPAPDDALQRLARACVAIVGAGPVGTAVADNLVALGSRTLVLSGRGSEELASRLAPPGGDVRVDAYPASAMDGAVAEEVFARAPDLVVVALEGERAALLRAVNVKALEARIPWIPAVLRHRQAECGPSVLPGESACWRCYELRRHGAHPWLDRHLAYAALHEAGLAPVEDEWGFLPTAASALGALAAQEAMAIVTGHWPPALRNHVAVMDVLQATSRRHRVLKLPRCPACGASGVPDVDTFDLGVFGG